MTVALHGLGVSRGIAVGRAVVFKREELQVTEYSLTENDIPREIERYRGALQQVQVHLRNLRERFVAATPVDFSSFIETHLLILGDPVFVNGPLLSIREMGCNAEWAVKLQRDALIGVFDSMDDNYLRARQDDVDLIVTQILRALLNEPAQICGATPGTLEGAVVVAEDLSPTDVVVLHEHRIAAIVAETGGITSHTAIMARNLGIPSVFGLSNIRRFLVTGETVIVDGRHGLVIVTPDPSLLRFYAQRRGDEHVHSAALERLRDQPSKTRDGFSTTLAGNAEFLHDVHMCKTVKMTQVSAGVACAVRTVWAHSFVRTAHATPTQYLSLKLCHWS